MINKSFRKTALIMCALLMVTGCEKNKSVDYEIEGSTEKENSEAVMEASSNNLEQFRNLDHWKEDLGIPYWKDSKYTYKADAEIVIPEGNGMMLMELEEAMNDEEEWKAVCGQLFESYEKYDGDWPTEHSYQKFIPIHQYMGTIDGKEYVIGKYRQTTDDVDEEKPYIFEDVIKFSINNLKDIAPKEVSNPGTAYCYPNYNGWDFDSSTGVYTFIERELTEKEESVKKQAEEFVKKLGINAPVFRGIGCLDWISQYKTVATDDYFVEFSLGSSGDEVRISSDEFYQVEPVWISNRDGWELEGCGYIKNCYNMTFARVYINEDGVFQAEIDRPLKVANITHQVQLLPFEKIKEILCNELKNQELKPESYYINNIRLTYVNVTDYEEYHKFSIVPAWIVETTNENFIINAVDGTIITSKWQEWIDKNSQKGD